MQTLWKWLFALAFLAPPTLYAQESGSRIKPPNITVTGEALLMVEPDQAEIDVGVVTQSKTAPEAAGENAERAARVIAALRKLLTAADEIKTSGYTLTPSYRYPKEGGKPEIVGYTATNVVRIRTGALKSVGNLIDTAMRSGANRVQRLVFTLKDPLDAQRSALREATVKAKSKAEEVARALGVKITKVLSVTESGQGFQPRMAEALAARADAMPAAPTPIEPGTIEVRSTVTLTAEIAER
jgi:hypothetical protein